MTDSTKPVPPTLNANSIDLVEDDEVETVAVDEADPNEAELDEDETEPAARRNDDDDEDDGEDGEDEEEAERGGGDADLFRQSEIAADYIEGLLDILDVDGDIDELVQNGRPMVEVVGGRLTNLVGSRGATLEALQELSRLAIYRQTGEPSRLLLDVGGFRAARRKELIAVAKNAVEKVRRHGEAVRLEPMSAFERKCVHDVINATAGVESESEGVEPSRRIVVRAVEV
ncbi:MAG TPA: R3H domain-containing nucleic acid-binding protein [Jiangellales bacterium]|nr:R3H domain-containing nucleic acid-binding protein [Jiangellales bacterium]